MEDAVLTIRSDDIIFTFSGRHILSVRLMEEHAFQIIFDDNTFLTVISNGYMVAATLSGASYAMSFILTEEAYQDIRDWLKVNNYAASASAS
jgi:hypothetical protein